MTMRTHVHPPTTGTTTGRDHREEVRAMKNRRNRQRAWDQLSATDRAVLLDAVRRRREEQEQRREALGVLNGTRHVR